MLRTVSALALILAALSAGTALAASTVNPAVPATNSQLQSVVVRNNFAAANSDINNILGKFAGPTAPSTPTNLQDWVNTSGSPVYAFNVYNAVLGTWSTWGQLNANTGAFTTTTSLVSGTTVITGGASGKILYDTGGTLGEAKPAILEATPVAPTGNTSATFKMSGMGGVCTITPVFSSRVQVHFRVTTNASAATVVSSATYWGTGTAPANNASATGTVLGNYPIYAVGTGSYVLANLTDIVTGLTPGTAIWFDLGLANTSGASVSYSNVTCEAYELP